MQDRMRDMAQALSERIKARHKLVQLAKQIVQQMPEPAQPAGVDDVSYANCGLDGVDYQCYGYYMYYDPDPAYCSGSRAFVCKQFACAQDSTDFVCQEVKDHTCSDSFSCSFLYLDNAHSCEGKHGFYCDDEFDCFGDFTCKAGGSPCIPADSYSLENGKDVTPGDFTCGWPGGGPDDFDCSTDFGCVTQDDFRCVHSTDFDCGTGDPIDRFNCGATGGTTQFQCDGIDFSCLPMTKFGCAVEFQCQKSDPFDCQNYICPAEVTYKDMDF